MPIEQVCPKSTSLLQYKKPLSVQQVLETLDTSIKVKITLTSVPYLEFFEQGGGGGGSTDIVFIVFWGADKTLIRAL